MDIAADLAVLIRNIAAEINGGSGPTGAVASLDGRVVGYDQPGNLITVALTHYYLDNGDPFILAVPYGMFMAGDTYGDYFYPENNTFCVVSVVEGSTGESVQVCLLHDGLKPPANLTGSANPSPNLPSIFAPLQPGERLILHKGGTAIRFTEQGLQMGTTSGGGQVPAAVEGSIVDPTAWLSALGVMVTNAIAAAVPNDGGVAALTFLANALTALISDRPSYLLPADALMWVDSPTHDPVVGSGGSQATLLNEAGTG